MSERSPFTPSGILSRMLALAARKSPKGINVIFAAGYGICEVLGAQALLSTLWPILQGQLKERLNASKDTCSDKQGATAGASQAEKGNLPKHDARMANGNIGTNTSTISTGNAK